MKKSMTRATALCVALLLQAYSHAASPKSFEAPSYVAVGSSLELKLNSGDVLAGQWLIDWGDTTSSTVSLPANTASHTYTQRGIYTISATLQQPLSSEAVSVDYTQQVRETGPELYYNFNDATGSQHIGPAYTLMGSPPVIEPSAGANTGNALGFNGSNYLRSSSALRSNRDFFGLEFWLKPNDLINKQMIFAGRNSAQGNVRVYIEQGHLHFELLGSGRKSISLSSIQLGTWHHFAVSYERSPYFLSRNVVRLYMDGYLQLEDSFAAHLSRATHFSSFTIGASEPGSGVFSYLNGALDEVVLHPLGIFPGSYLQRHKSVTDPTYKFRVAVGTAGPASFTVDLPNITHEVEVRLDPSAASNRQALQAAINSALPGTRLKIVTTTGQAGGRFYFRSTGDPNWENMVLASKTDLEIDGNGATFVFSEPNTKAFKIKHCTRIAVRNLTFEVDENANRPGAYARILNIDPASGTLDIQYVKGNPLVADPMPDGFKMWRWRRVDAATRILKGSLSMSTPAHERARTLIDDGSGNLIPDPDRSKWTYTLSNATTSLWTDLQSIQAAGDLLQLNGYKSGGGVFTIWQNQHATFDSIHIHSTMGMSFLSANDDYLKVSNVKIGPPNGVTVYDRPFASCSDAFHFHGDEQGHLIFENNDIALSDDDPISLKQTLWNATAAQGNVIEVASDEFTALVGDEIELMNPKLEPFSPRFFARVEGFERSTRQVTLSATPPFAQSSSYKLINHRNNTSNWVFRGNNFHDQYGRMLIFGQTGIFENNRFYNLSFYIGYSLADLAGYAHDVIMRNNMHYGGEAGRISTWRTSNFAPVNYDITVINNSFVRYPWTVQSVDSALMANNYFEQITPTAAGDGIIALRNRAVNTHIFGNTHYMNTTGVPFITSDDTSSYQEADNLSAP